MPFTMNKLRKEVLVVPICNSLAKEGKRFAGHGAGKLSAEQPACDKQSCTGEQGFSLSLMGANRLQINPVLCPAV